MWGDGGAELRKEWKGVARELPHRIQMVIVHFS